MSVLDGGTGLPGGRGWAPAGSGLATKPNVSWLPTDLQSLFRVACRRGVARGGDLHPKEKKHY